MKAKTVLFILLFCPIFIFGQTWDYPVKPGREEWKNLESHDEKISVCQIPDNVLKKCSTEDLLEICLNYPLSFDFYAYNSLKEGVIKVSNRFNGLKELFSRKDNFSVIQKRIDVGLMKKKIESKLNDKHKGEIIHKYTLMECLLGLDEFINNATPIELVQLKEKATKILEYKLNNKTAFSNYAGETSALLLGKSLKKINPDVKFSKETELFLESGIINSSKTFMELKNNGTKEP